MFGYFRPFDANLTKGQLKLFNSYYCRLCYCLRSTGGQICRAMTTFDATLYSIALHLQLGLQSPPRLKCQRFSKSQLKLFEDDELGLKIARLTLVTFGEKFRDDRLDGASLKTKMAESLFAKRIKKAQELEPELTRIAYEGTEEINRLQDGGAPLEEIFAAYGNMAVASFQQIAPLTELFARFFKALSEWVFFIDMVCDYADDYKSGAYNGFKTAGCATFVDYFNLHYQAFAQVEKRMSGNLIDALYGIKTDDSLWYILCKVIMKAINEVVPKLIAGEDVTFHYFREIHAQHKRVKQTEKEQMKYAGENE